MEPSEKNNVEQGLKVSVTMNNLMLQRNHYADQVAFLYGELAVYEARWNSLEMLQQRIADLPTDLPKVEDI